MQLARCPEVLVLTLKRFGRQLGAFGRFLPDKLQDHVDFPLDGFDVAPYLLGGGGGGDGAAGDAAAAQGFPGGVQRKPTSPPLQP